jgi:hypothetical protein
MVLQLNRSITQKIWKKNIPCRILLFFLMNNRRRQVSLDPSFLSIVCVFAIVVLLITLFINVNILYLNKMHLLNELFYGRCMLERVVIMNLSYFGCYLHLKINENKYVCSRKSDGVVFSTFYI